MAPPAQEVQKGSPDGAPLAESLLQALKTSIGTPAEKQPEYRAMLSALQRSTEKSEILRNVRTMVDKLEPQERAIITQNLVALEQRLEMTTEFEDLRQEIQELKVAVTRTQESVLPAAAAPADALKQAAADSEKWFPRSADPSEWSGKQIATVSTLTLGLVGLFAWWKLRKKEETPPQANAPIANTSEVKKKRSSLWYWLPGIGLGAVALIFAHSKLMQLDGYAKQYKKLEEKVVGKAKTGADAVQQKGDVVREAIQEHKDEAVSFVAESKEVIDQRVQVNAFIFEHKKELGSLDDNDKTALSSFMNDAEVQKLSPKEFAASTPEKLLKRTPNSSDEEIFASLQKIANADAGRHETMQELFRDTFMGGITARVKEAIGDASIQDVKTSKIAQAVFGGADQLRVLARQANVREGLNTAGVSSELSGAFLEKILLHGNEHVDAAMQHFPEFREPLQHMKAAVQQKEAIALITSLGHNKGKAGEILGQQILHNGATHLTLKDTVELYMCLQLIKGQKQTLPNNLKEGNPAGAYLMQMKALDLLSRSENGEEASKGVKMFLLFRGVDAAVGLSDAINLPPEVLEQLQEVTQSLAEIICNSIIEKGLDLADWIIEAEIEAWTNHYAYYGLVPAAHLALAAEIKNMYDGLYLKRLAKIRDLDEAFRFGIYSEPALEAIKQNAQNYKAIQKIFSPSVLKRTPGISQFITSGFVQYDRYQKLIGWTGVDTPQLSVAFMRSGRYPHMSESIIDQIKILAENARAHAGAAIAHEGKNVGVVERSLIWWRRAELPMNQKALNMLRDLEQINVPLVDKTHKIIEQLSANTMPSASDLKALGLSQEKITAMMDVFQNAGIGTKTAKTAAAAGAVNAFRSSEGDSLDNARKSPQIEGDTGLKKAVGDGVAEPLPDAARRTGGVPDTPALKVVRQSGEVVEATTGKVLNEADALTDAATSTAAGAGASEVSSVAKSGEAMSKANEARFQQLLTKFGESADVQNVRAFLDAAAEQKLLTLDAEVIALIDQSPGAQKIIAGAVKSNEVTEVMRALDAAKAARNFRVGLNAVGAAGDLFGAYMAYCDYSANGARIETAMNTKNAALADMYRNANYVYGAEGAQSVAGLTIGGVAIVKAYVGGQSLLTALGASGGLIMLPVAAATLSGGFVYRKAEGVAETWLRNAKDWERALSPGELLEKLKELGPGKRGYWQGWGKGTIAEQMLRVHVAGQAGNADAYMQWEEEGDHQIEKANESTRAEITMAYVVRTSLLAKKPDESDAVYKQRFDLYVIDQMEFIGRTSEGSFSYMLGDTYGNARKYAEMLGKMRDEGKRPEAMPWRNSAASTDKQRAMQEYVPRELQQKILQFNLMQRMPTQLTLEQKKMAVKQDLILACQDDLLKLDGRIASTNFEGVGGTEGVGEASARYTASELFRERLAAQTDRLLEEASKPEGLTMISYQSIVNKLGVVLETDPLELQRISWKRNYVPSGHVTDLNATRNLLTAEYQLQSLHEQQKTVQAIEKEKTLSPEELQKECFEKGKLLLFERGASQNGEKFQLQMGWIFNKYLYARFQEGRWQVGFVHGYTHWRDPEQFSVKGLVNSWGGVDPKIAGKYNEVIRELAAINKRYGKPQEEKKAA